MQSEPIPGTNSQSDPPKSKSHHGIDPFPHDSYAAKAFNPTRPPINFGAIVTQMQCTSPLLANALSVDAPPSTMTLQILLCFLNFVKTSSKSNPLPPASRLHGKISTPEVKDICD
mmetsp:Transcript_10584/g.17548  ORF Transcript_10584/g.17548 Transcript_10584/m.17548 type:complete len:115 (+) Transcript_10584:120-464(+)